jgi:hypothetical protein
MDQNEKKVIFLYLVNRGELVLFTGTRGCPELFLFSRLDQSASSSHQCFLLSAAEFIGVSILMVCGTMI